MEDNLQNKSGLLYDYYRLALIYRLFFVVVPFFSVILQKI